jgi:hypothetical protein
MPGLLPLLLPDVKQAIAGTSCGWSQYSSALLPIHYRTAMKGASQWYEKCYRHASEMAY